MPSFDRSRFLLARWTIYSILVVTYMLVFFHRMAPAVISADLMAAFQTSGAALGSLAATYFYIYTAMQIPAGVLADTLGARVTVTAGSLVAGGGSLLFGMAGGFATASAMDLAWDGRMTNGVRVYAATDYHSGFLLMLLFALLGVTGACKVRETLCRNCTVGD